MLECFENLVGISGDCEPTTPTSGLYLNELPGLKNFITAAAVTGENASYKDLINNLIKVAVNEVTHEFRAIVQPHLVFNSIIENDNIGFYKPDQVAEALSAGNYRGIRIGMERRPNIAFHLNSVTLKLDAALAVTVRVFDVMTGTQLDSFVINTVAGYPTIKTVNKTYLNYGQNLRLAVVYDSGVAGTFTTKASPLSGGNCAGCDGRYANKYISFEGITVLKTADVIDPNITTISGTAGLSLSYTLACDAAYTLCSVASILAQPILYKTAEKIYLELQAPTTRLNSIITVQAKEVVQFYEFYGSEYQKTISPILQMWHPPQDECFYCAPKIRKQVLIP